MPRSPATTVSGFRPPPQRHGTEKIAAELAGLEACVDKLAGRISALETSVNCVILLVERVAKSQRPAAQGVDYPQDDGDKIGSLQAK